MGVVSDADGVSEIGIMGPESIPEVSVLDG